MVMTNRGRPRLAACSALAVLAVGASFGCGHDSSGYGYRPTTQVSATHNGFPASRYGVPSAAPRGEVIVTSFGFAELELAPERREPFVHVRLSVTNADPGATWSVDPWRQVLALPNQGPFGPAYLNASAPLSSRARVRPGEKVTMDLFFSLPPALKREARVPGYEFIWSLDTGAGRTVSERTRFERFEPATEGQPPTDAVAVGWGPLWWSNPWWPARRPSLGREPWPRRLVAHPHPRVVHLHRPYLVTAPSAAVVETAGVTAR